jgi:hypothetical protein
LLHFGLYVCHYIFELSFRAGYGVQRASNALDETFLFAFLQLWSDFLN